LAALAENQDCLAVVAQSGDDALATASEISSADGVVLVTGSLYLVGELRQELVENWL
jgi:folylpolyglutamate synthase/dihydropteroate synthase